METMTALIFSYLKVNFSKFFKKLWFRYMIEIINTRIRKNLSHVAKWIK